MKIKELTYKSQARLLFTLKNSDVIFSSMVTLTYPSVWPKNGKEAKRHLQLFLKRLKREMGNFQYAWFVEFQKRGAPHFHILTTLKNDGDWGKATYALVAKAWYEVVGSGDKRHLVAGTRLEALRDEDGAVRYASKYVSKKSQKIVPDDYQDIGRFWGTSYGVKPMPFLNIDTTSDAVCRILFDGAEFPPYSTFFDKSGDFVAGIPRLLLADVQAVGALTGETVTVEIDKG